MMSRTIVIFKQPDTEQVSLDPRETSRLSVGYVGLPKKVTRTLACCSI